MMTRQIQPNEGYEDKIKKLLPGEVSAAFLAINSIIPWETDNSIWIGIVIIILCFISILHLHKFEKVLSKLQIFFTSFILFPIWAINIALSRFTITAEMPWVPGVLLILVTTLTPIIFGRNNGNE